MPAAAYSLDDRHRSIRRFLMNALGSPPWTVRTERQPVADEQRPVAVVEVVSVATTTFRRTSIPQGDIRRTQTFTLSLYPVLLATAAESRQVAAQVAEALSGAIDVGLSNDDGSVLSAPGMLPVYDFAAVPVKGALRAGPAELYGWLTVEDAPVRPVQDPDDPLRWGVFCDLRVSWWQGGRVRPEAPLAGEMAWQRPGVSGSPPWPPRGVVNVQP